MDAPALRYTESDQSMMRAGLRGCARGKEFFCPWVRDGPRLPQ